MRLSPGHPLVCIPVCLLAQQYPGIDGFLGSRATLMLDIVFVSMFAIVPLMLWSIHLVKRHARYRVHKRMQLTLGATLLVAVSAFEVEQQLIPWEARAEPSPYFDAVHPWTCPVGISLIIHLFFAVPTVFLWIFVIVQALRKFPRDPLPGQYSKSHIWWARWAAFEMAMTAVTGWAFYYLAFVAA